MKNKIGWYLITISVITIMIYFAYQQGKTFERDPVYLLNQYYIKRKQDPVQARQALVILLRQDPHHEEALKNMAYSYINANQPEKAIPYMKKLKAYFPENPDYALNFNYLKQKSKEKMSKVSLSKTPKMVVALSPHQQLKQSIDVLLNQFYQTNKEDRKKAFKQLKHLQTIAPDNPAVLRALGYYYLKYYQPQQALEAFGKAYQQQPTEALALQIAYLFVTLNQPEQAKNYFQAAMLSKDPQIVADARRGYDMIKKEREPEKLIRIASATQLSTRDEALNQYYKLEKINSRQAWHLITRLTIQYPRDINILKTAGYLGIKLQRIKQANRFFLRIYALNHSPNIALQIAYLFNQMKENHKAYHYFKLAAKSRNPEVSLKANRAMTTLRGIQTKFYPKPYFSQILFEPFSQTRFGLTVTPLIMRFGVEKKDWFNSKFYMVYRQTLDNKSANLGQLPQIFEDNVRILGLGIQLQPVKDVPLIGFFEAGQGYDVIDRNRSRWRNDFRGGLVYFNEFGAMPSYYDQQKWSHDYYSQLYGDAIYYSRYDDNVIATVRTRQGIRLWQHHSTMLNLYITGRIVVDKNRDFFNNIAEIGPGVSLIPLNRYSVILRYEYIRGVYLPAGGSFNPYNKYYNNSTIQLIYYLNT